MKSQYATNLGKNFPVGRLAIGRTGHYAQDVPSSSLFSICECSLSKASRDFDASWGLILKLLMSPFLWHPQIPGTLKLDSIFSLLKCVAWHP